MRYSFYESVQDSAGNVLNAANVSIYLTGTATPAKVYNSNGTLQSAAPQLQTDSKGYFWFEVDNADYTAEQLFDIKITKAGYTDLLIKEITIIGVSKITAGKIIIADANGLPAEGTNTDAEVSMAVADAHTHANKALLDTYDQTDTDLTDAVAKKHSQQHSIASSTDHTSTATPDQILKADANGLPINATNTDTEVSGAVTKANSALQNVVEDTTPQLGGALDAQAHTIYFTLQTYTGVVGTTNIDWTKGNKAKFTFGAGNETLTFTDPAGACGLTLIVVQDSTGGRTLTYPTGIKWVGGVEPTLSTTADAIDVITFIWDGTNYYGQASLDFN